MKAWAGAFALWLTLAASAVSAAVPAQAPILLRVGIPAPTVNMLPMWLGRAEGLFRARGLDVTILNTGGGSKGLAALRAHSLDIMNVGLSAVIDENSKGADFRMIAASANTMSFGFFAASGTTGAMLKGARIGISTLKSESDVAATLALKRLGLERGDVMLVEIGTTEDRLAALLTGRIKATPLNEPVSLMARQRGLLQLVNLAENQPWILNGIVVRRETIQTNRTMLLNFMRAYDEAIHFALANPARAQAVLRAEFQGLDAEGARATYDDFKRRIPRDARASAAAAASMFRELPALGTQGFNRNILEHLDPSIVDALAAENFVGALRMKYRTE